MSRIGISVLGRMFPIATAAFLLLAATAARAEVITRLPTEERVVALTFDACESVTPAELDRRIVSVLAAEGVPYTVFVGGRFARHQRDALAALAATGMVELENHSFNHPQHMERLSPERIRREVEDTEALIRDITGRSTRFFRFPAGHYDGPALALVESLGHRVVHWETPSGDPAAAIDAETLLRWVLGHTRPGTIHIFHINGRGRHTAAILPRLIAELRRKGYRFVRLDEFL
ncbi:MAG: polysaccharide deacetylase family protein [Alphaproteobacteria bacterium]|nr:polysaccharide deacetylase family protein [Alphaproteobacteria bacterium]